MLTKIFLDMDGPLANFDKAIEDNNILDANNNRIDKVYKVIPNIYRNLEPTEHAIESVAKLIELGYDVYILTKAPHGHPEAYSDKVRWVMEHLPALTDKIIISSNKGIIGDVGDYLIDDRPHKANCQAFKGTLFVFYRFLPNSNTNSWLELVEYFTNLKS